MNKWTPQDENKLQQLLAQKREIHEKNMYPLLETVRRVLDSYDTDGETMTRALIEHADTFRDLLEPFDSGARCSPS